MIKILDDTKNLKDLASDTTNGLGQIETNSALVTEELNGIYEAEIALLANDKHYDDLKVGGLLKMSVNESGSEQIFRIYYISRPINQVVTVKAQHITYDLNKYAVLPFTAKGAVNVKNNLITHTDNMANPFSMETNITNTTSSFTLDIPRTFRECLGGYEGSVLDTFRCEYEWDNLTVKMLSKRGTDNKVNISYGKNLTDFQQEENIENVYTSVLCYAVIDNVTYTGDIYRKVESAYPKTLIVDVSSEYSYETLPSRDLLTKRAEEYAKANDIEVPNVNLTISFIPLYQTEEYKDIAPLERVNLGDTVYVNFDKLGVKATSRVIKTVWNVNLGRYESIELGNTKANLNTVLNQVTQSVTKDISDNKGFLEAELNEMSSLIINGLGLHKTLVGDEEGGYKIYLHNKKTLEESDTQYIFTSEGFLISTDYGQTWNAGFDSEGNAILNSLATITLKALEITGGTITGSTINGTTINFGNLNGTYISAGPNASNNGVLFDGNGLIDIKSRRQLSLINKDNNDVTKNSITLTGATGNSKIIQLLNNSDVQGNSISMLASNAGNNVNIINRDLTGSMSNQFSIVANNDERHTQLLNYAESGNLANYTIFKTNSDGNDISIVNSDSSGALANYIKLNSSSDGNLLYLANYYNGSPSNVINFSTGDGIAIKGNNFLSIGTNGEFRITVNNQTVSLVLQDGYVKYTTK